MMWHLSIYANRLFMSIEFTQYSYSSAKMALAACLCSLDDYEGQESFGVFLDLLV